MAAGPAGASPLPQPLSPDQWACWYVAGNPPIAGCLDNPWPAIDNVLFACYSTHHPLPPSRCVDQ